MSEELCPKCNHKIMYHAKSTPGCNVKLSDNPGLWCTCDETQSTIALQAKLEIAVDALEETRLNINSGKSALFSTDEIHIYDAKFYINRSIYLVDEALKKLEEK